MSSPDFGGIQFLSHEVMLVSGWMILKHTKDAISELFVEFGFIGSFFCWKYLTPRHWRRGRDRSWPLKTGNLYRLQAEGCAEMYRVGPIYSGKPVAAQSKTVPSYNSSRRANDTRLKKESNQSRIDILRVSGSEMSDVNGNQANWKSPR
jgi:hypothetical protein